MKPNPGKWNGEWNFEIIKKLYLWKKIPVFIGPQIFKSSRRNTQILQLFLAWRIKAPVENISSLQPFREIHYPICHGGWNSNILA